APEKQQPAPVFVVKKEIRDALEQNSLAYRPLQLWQMLPEEITELRLQKAGQEYRLKRDGQAWKIVDLDAGAVPNMVQPMLDNLNTLRCERYEAHVAKEPEKFGLDQPYMRVSVVAETTGE